MRGRPQYYNLLELQALSSFSARISLTYPKGQYMIQVRLFKSYFAGGR